MKRPKAKKSTVTEITNDIEETICAAYDSGLSLAFVSTKTGVPHRKVREVLVSKGREIKARILPSRAKLKRGLRVLKLRERYSLQECAEKVGITSRQGAYRIEQQALKWQEQGYLK